MIEQHFFTILACVLGFLMTWGVGANDLANVMSTTMGSKAISVRQALFIAVIFEFAGAFFGGSHVTQTMRNGIINISSLSHEPRILIDGMLAVLLAGMTWMNLASYLGLPVSITNAIVGSVVGFGMVVLGVNAIHWQQVSYIAISWVSSPTIAGIVAYILFIAIQQSILARKEPIKQARRYIPLYLFAIGLVLSFMVVLKGLEHFHFVLTLPEKFFITVTCGVFITLIGLIFTMHVANKAQSMHRREQFKTVEKMFGVLMGFTACAMVFAHGSNDVAIAVGPMTVVVCLVQNADHLMAGGGYPAWIMALGCLGVVTGLMMYGRKVIETVGRGITTLTPSRAFAATLAAATTVVVSTSTGVPVSATQTLVGAVLGVGLARGIGALNLVVIRNIFMSWIITLPAASILTIIFYHGFHWLFP